MSDMRIRLKEEMKLLNSRYKASPKEVLTEVTEGRINTPNMKYSFCGDTASYILMKCGAPAAALNRERINGKWRAGENISTIINYAKMRGAIKPWKDVKYGDILVLPRPAGDHICFGAMLETDDRAIGYRTFDGNGPTGGIAYHLREPTDIPIVVIDTPKLIEGGTTAAANTNVESTPDGSYILEVDAGQATPGDWVLKVDDKNMGTWRRL